MFEELHFTGAFNHLIPATRAEHEGHAAKRAVVSHHKRTKHEVMQQVNALLLVDDSAENAIHAAQADPPAKVLLFGSYPWNAEIVPPSGEGAKDAEDEIIYVDAAAQGKLATRAARRKARIDRGWLPAGVTRVKDWEAVVEFISKMA